MKRILLIILCCLLCAGPAAAEELTDYSGSWVVSSMQRLDRPEPQFPLPTQWGMDLPELSFREDGSASLRLGSQITGGTWKYDASSGEIQTTLAGEGVPLNLRAAGERLTCRVNLQNRGVFILRFAREEAADLTGTWKPILQTYGDGEYWPAYPGAETLTFTDGENGTFTADDVRTAGAVTAFKWTRYGNDVIVLIRAEDEEGAEDWYPWQFYRLEQGLLKRYEEDGDAGGVVTVYGNPGMSVETEAVETIRPLLNTAWELTGMDISGVRIPLSVTGDGTEEYLTFFAKGNGRLIHIEGEDQKQVKYNCSVESGTLNLLIPGQEPVSCYYADGGCIVRETENGRKFYYRRKWLPEAAGVPEDEKAPVDLAVECPAGASIRPGESVLMSAVFADPETVNAEKGNDAVSWQVFGPDGRDPEGVSISDTGLLSTEASLAAPVGIRVVARSVFYGTAAEYILTVSPD